MESWISVGPVWLGLVVIDGGHVTGRELLDALSMATLMRRASLTARGMRAHGGGKPQRRGLVETEAQHLEKWIE